MSDYASPIEVVHTSTKGKFGFCKLHASRLNISALGYVVSASALGGALIRSLPQEVTMRPVEVKALCYDNALEQWTIATNKGMVSAGLLVGADGANSMVREHLGIDAVETNYQETAIVCNIEVSSTISTAYERFTEHGVLALLPFGKHKVKCVFTCSTKYAREVLSMSDEEYLILLQEMFGNRIGKFARITNRKAFPICGKQARKIFATRAVLIGNAANTLHPVAAQGFNLGLRDVMTLASVLSEYALDYVAELYAKLRVSDQESTREFTNRILSVPADIRQAGIISAQFVPSLNKQLTLRGMGSWM